MTASVLIKSLLKPDIYAHAVNQVELIETHISWILLTGKYAYKIKKSLNLGFLDFSSLEKRKFFCTEELRLNQRFSSDLYLEVVAIYGSDLAPHFEQNGKVIEYAVKMKQFPGGCLLIDMLENSGLTKDHILNLAEVVANFHAKTKISSNQQKFGSPECIYEPVQENFHQISPLVPANQKKHLIHLRKYVEDKYSQLYQVFIQRKMDGYVRECHGDMHLGNLVYMNDNVVPFDCIEFNENLRWIDVMSEVAFLVMDLKHRGRADYANILLNRYLEITGDYAGLSVLVFYLMYRAMVRAKVAYIASSQHEESDEKNKLLEEGGQYLELTGEYSQDDQPSLLIMMGLSGAGKTWLAKQLAPKANAIHIRSDIERKRLLGLNEYDDTNSGLGNNAYSQDMTEVVYQRLNDLSVIIIDAGFSVIVDATFLSKQHRDMFVQLATEKNIKYKFINAVASNDELQSRIINRQAAQSDASEATLDVLENQIKHLQPLEKTEMLHVIDVDTTKKIDLNKLVSSTC